MTILTSPSRRLDTYSLEMIFAARVITLHDFLLSSAMSLPLALQRSAVGQLRSLDRVGLIRVGRTDLVPRQRRGVDKGRGKRPGTASHARCRRR